MTLCLQCALRACVNGEHLPAIDESPEDHMRRCHPDPVETRKERVELERRAMEKIAQMNAKKG